MNRPAPPPDAPARPNTGTPPRLPPGRMWWIFLGILLANWLVARWLVPAADAPVTVPYTVFREQAAQGNVVSIYSRGTSIEGRFTKPFTWPPEGADAGAAGAPTAEPGRTERRAGRGPAAHPGPPRTSATFTTELPAFVEMFVRLDGKLNWVAQELKVSYPTVRSRLDDVIRAMGHEVHQAPPAEEKARAAEQRQAILDDLAAGKISSAEAIKQLQGP